jgi:hypothetical protein
MQTIVSAGSPTIRSKAIRSASWVVIGRPPAWPASSRSSAALVSTACTRRAPKSASATAWKPEPQPRSTATPGSVSPASRSNAACSATFASNGTPNIQV